VERRPLPLPTSRRCANRRLVKLYPSAPSRTSRGHFLVFGGKKERKKFHFIPCNSNNRTRRRALDPHVAFINAAGPTAFLDLSGSLLAWVTDEDGWAIFWHTGHSIILVGRSEESSCALARMHVPRWAASNALEAAAYHKRCLRARTRGRRCGSQCRRGPCVRVSFG
jgi:hypothetical protein